MDCEKVCTRKDFVERRELDFEIARLFGCDKRIIRDNKHSHRARTRSDDTTNATKTNNAERLALQLDADELLPIPVSRLETAARLRDRSRQRDEHRDRVLG